MKDTVKPLGQNLNVGPHTGLNTHYQFDASQVSQDIIQYYSQVGLDYEPWSPNYNMHFGYYLMGMNPFKREPLLVEMNHQVLSRLQLDTDAMNQVIDLGCGVGATARYCAQHYENTYITGATVVPWQIEKASVFTEQASLHERASFHLIDYRNTPFPDNSFNGAYAVESSCYADGTSKASFINEAFRILKPGARLVVADGFRKRTKSNPLFEKAFRLVCKGWSVDTFANIHDFTQALRDAGFVDIKVKDSSWRALPSVLHVPWVSIKYFFSNIAMKKGERTMQKMHFIAPVMGMVIGMHRRDFAYYLVSARKPEQ
ncbi:MULTISPECIES: methyltransferase domain-containing protein [Alteromonadaceae]|jgi:SAM-dependent methyltransferase|uniref:Methyltransferase domain-containing protein n=1 Tax=Brumicola blandensis TaxID=3075611 RepID=A0AAW8R1M5_9ALTE|nr:MULTISPECIES: methyltransferase domain-containing protein [unclassified Alteromonas]MDT0582053.1 methyltransferase domain-containing protein [Alteromonas sp. W409]MDT0627991.1 methyltransferase domain-containing protein [Alteromonas sp. W364]